MIAWTKEYSVGVDQIDSEHRKIVEMINELDRADGRHEEQKIVREVLKGIAVYVGRHFRAEEDAMRSAEYPHLDMHMKSHNDFTAKVLALNNRPDLQAPELRQLLFTWLVDHILKADRDYAPYIQEWLKKWSKKN